MKLYQVDAFTDRLFGGNPAAVVPLDHWLDDRLLQQIAGENNLSETAFLVPDEQGFALRWFTPTVEVDLCGHATLAAAWVVFHELGFAGERIRFQTASGALYVQRSARGLAMDFPARPGHPENDVDRYEQALGIAIREVRQARDTLVVVDDEDVVRDFQPDFDAIAALDTFAVMLSAPGSDCDFVSRFFAPAKGVPEDPVTGSAHCTLVPYWAERLDKTRLHARQVSARGGELFCALEGDRVQLEGQARCYLRGDLLL
ncbi:phenazine biosynthesis-like protein [Alcanivorax hongdengensis A-11-3]|uniref:Phenazine biosynthesis-like protein n=1 Tax=Alcanivorax hongdengensis A-11-3 TaxID=1177179 RepID=L0WFU4_9GAMM|nr:PhzF family phenazine biosynthesis protein [Alcanivorax hongdengensis]EKF75584.1 phenazine biosynthesis-like protein [Alcanivorax hongdengensis A-11-3]